MRITLQTKEKQSKKEEIIMKDPERKDYLRCHGETKLMLGTVSATLKPNSIKQCKKMEMKTRSKTSQDLAGRWAELGNKSRLSWT